jgi:hypothetical protein
MNETENKVMKDPAEIEGFKKWAECLKAFKDLRQPTSETERNEFMEKLAASADSRFMAFRLLCLPILGKQNRQLKGVSDPLVAILGKGEELERFERMPSPSHAANWVYRKTAWVNEIADWKDFQSQGDHLWVLYTIFRGAEQKAPFVEALTAFGECVEHALSKDSQGRPKRSAPNCTDTKWMVNSLLARIPEKPSLPNSFIDNLFAITATADLAEDLRRKANGLTNQVEELNSAIEDGQRRLREAEAKNLKIEQDLVAAKRSLSETSGALMEEKLHGKRQSGFDTKARSNVINEVLAKVRRACDHRLENIKLYADREQPNREEIIESVAEIRAELARIGEEMNK